MKCRESGVCGVSPVRHCWPRGRQLRAPAAELFGWITCSLNAFKRLTKQSEHSEALLPFEKSIFRELCFKANKTALVYEQPQSDPVFRVIKQDYKRETSRLFHLKTLALYYAGIVFPDLLSHQNERFTTSLQDMALTYLGRHSAETPNSTCALRVITGLIPDSPASVRVTEALASSWSPAFIH